MLCDLYPLEVTEVPIVHPRSGLEHGGLESEDESPKVTAIEQRGLGLSDQMRKQFCYRVVYFLLTVSLSTI